MCRLFSFSGQTDLKEAHVCVLRYGRKLRATGCGAVSSWCACCLAVLLCRVVSCRVVVP